MSPGRLIFGLIPWYSVLVVAGMAAAILLAQREEIRMKLPKETAVDLALLVIPFGVLGARLYYVLFSWRSYISDPLSVLYIWEGGLAIYGGIIGGALAICCYARKKGLMTLQLLDMICPGLALAQAIGRWGNFFNTEAYGIPVADPRFCFFPLAVLVPEGTVTVWHFATFFYESCWDLFIFFALWRRRTSRTRHGQTLFWYLLLYGAGRQLIEPLRMDSLMLFETVRVSQLLACILCYAALIALFRQRSLSSQRRWIVPAFAALIIVSAASLMTDLIWVRLLFAAGIIIPGLLIDRETEGSECRQER